MPLELPKKRRNIVKRDLAKRYWRNNDSTPEQIAAKYKVSISTGYRWISEWKEEQR